LELPTLLPLHDVGVEWRLQLRVGPLRWLRLEAQLWLHLWLDARLGLRLHLLCLLWHGDLLDCLQLFLPQLRLQRRLPSRLCVDSLSRPLPVPVSLPLSLARAA